MLPVFDGFADVADLEAGFELGEGYLAKVDVRIAIYDLYDYEGSAFVVFFGEDGLLYEVNDSHCSCNGLDNWSPEATSIAALRTRWSVVNDRQLQAALDELEKNELDETGSRRKAH
jgi:hypothetical protein